MEGNQSRVTTVVLLGRTGNGKSSTGNSLLGRHAFKSGRSSKGVTDTCKMEQTVLNDGRILNVVDTPGLFDTSVHPNYLGKEISKCINFAKDGVHGVLLVLSVINRFTAEEAMTLENLQNLLGKNIVNYMVVVFTGGDEIEDNDETLEDFLRNSPPNLQKLLRECNHRVVLFNNKTKSATQKAKQATELLKLSDIVMDENGGQPYSNELFREAQARAKISSNLKESIASSDARNKEVIESLKRDLEKARAEQIKFSQMVEEKVRLFAELQNLERQLAVERSVRKDAELKSQSKSDEHFGYLQPQFQSPNYDIIIVCPKCPIM